MPPSFLRALTLLLPAGLGAAAVLVAGEPAVDKSAYSLARPTPDAFLREMNTDRPDTTEGPYTIDAGRLQLEMDLASYARDNSAGVRTRTLTVAPFNLRVGLRADVEAGIFVAPCVRRTEEEKPRPGTAVRGADDLGLRAKVNFRGNDGGGLALGAILDMTVPTGARGIGAGKSGGAVTLPLAGELGAGWDFGAMTRVALAYGDGHYDRMWINSATIGHALAAEFEGFLELLSQTGAGAHVCSLNFGVTRKFGQALQLDAGMNVGLSRAADDERFFAGLARRF